QRMIENLRARNMSRIIYTIAALLLLATCAHGQDSQGLAVNQLTKHAGFLTLYTDPKGRIYIEIPSEVTEFLYQPILASGFGHARLTDSDKVILDRGYLGSQRLVTFRRYGDNVLLIQRNTKYFTPSAAFGSSMDAGLSFADSVVTSFPIVPTNG